MAPKILLILMFVLPVISRGEYRAYELRIANAASGKTRTVTSTLDQYQYPEYHHVGAGEAVEYVTSWMCPGRTGNFLAICANPEGQPAPAQNPGTPNSSDPALQNPAK